MKSTDATVLLIAISHYFSAIIFCIFSKLTFSKIERPTLLRNYFTYFVIFQCAHIFISRIIYIGQENSFWELYNILSYGLPLCILIAFTFRKECFVWFYFIYSIGTVLYYILNIFEPNMILRFNLYVIVEHLLIISLYLWYLNKNFNEEFLRSFDAFKFWLLDFDKKEALWAFVPFVVFAIIVVLIIIIKFRHVIVTRMLP